jgi:hypothetical protein
MPLVTVVSLVNTASVWLDAFETVALSTPV